MALSLPGCQLPLTSAPSLAWGRAPWAVPGLKGLRRPPWGSRLHHSAGGPVMWLAADSSRPTPAPALGNLTSRSPGQRLLR